MRRASLLLSLAVALLALPLPAKDRIFDSQAGHDCFIDILRKSAWGLSGPYERAAFIVQGDDGSLRCVPWPATHSYLEERFQGTIPPGTIAIAHTHPVDYPTPSEHDIDEAIRLGIPNYVVTIRGVFKTVSDSREVAEIVHGFGWIRQPAPAVLAARKFGAVSASSR